MSHLLLSKFAAVTGIKKSISDNSIKQILDCYNSPHPLCLGCLRLEEQYNQDAFTEREKSKIYTEYEKKNEESQHRNNMIDQGFDQM